VAAREALTGIDSSEHILIMEALLAEMRRNADWSRARSDFRGAVILADNTPATAVLLMRFIRSLSLDRIPPWMSTMVRDKTWFES
jgi:hypothetical protein